MDLFAKQFSGGRRRSEKDNKKHKSKQVSVTITQFILVL